MQGLPSSQVALLFLETQPSTLSHVSVVHGLPSSHAPMALGTPTHWPPLQASTDVHALPSSHGLAAASCAQPVVGAHVSSVQRFLSSQSTGWPRHCPSTQLSFAVHALPSEQEVFAGLLVLTQAPLAVSQLWLVHGSPSVQVLSVPLTQTLAAQTSPMVQASPSSHGETLAANVQPVAGSQPSTVHGFLSSQSTPMPEQLPFTHASFTVQAEPSSHGPPGATAEFAHLPELVSQTSVVQALLSLQVFAWPGTQTLATHASPTVQRSPSVHGSPPAAVAVQPLAGSQASVVQGLPSSQVRYSPGVHTPPTHVSPCVQVLPSALQLPTVGVCWQAKDAATQVSVVHALLSSQLTGAA